MAAMNDLYHLSLEREIVLEMDPLGTNAEAGKLPTMRRETVLAIVSRSAQLPLQFHELLNEAGLLAASALEMEYFGFAEVRSSQTLLAGWGSVSDSTRNMEPVPVEIALNASTSGFGMAIESLHPIVVADAARDDRFRDSQLIGHRIHSGVICPIGFRDEKYGALGVFSNKPRTLAKADVLFVQSIALLLGPTRAHQNAERTLSEHTRFLTSAIDAIDAMVVLLRDDGAVSQINRTCQTLSGFTPGELRGRKVWSAFFESSEADAVRASLNELRSAQGRRRFESSLLTKQGEKRHVSWTVTRLPGEMADGAFLATGIDVTDQLRAMSRLGPPESHPATPGNADAPAEVSRSGAQSEEQAGGERRTHDRRPYSCVQSIAPCIDGKLPERSQFRPVRCHDISPRGFSFLLTAPPDFDELIAAFGSAQSRLYLRGRVIHSSPFRHGGRNVLLVGCEYIGRVRLPWFNNPLGDNGSDTAGPA
jgi:PAS domain S-box-containing protein